MDSRICDGHGDPSSQQRRLGCRQQCTDGEAKQQRLYYNAGVHQTPAVEGNSKRKRLRFQNKQAAGASPSQRTRRAVHRSCTNWEMLVREWGKLGSAIRRAAAAAAVCLAPSTGGVDEDDLGHHLPYVQIDKVTRAVSVSKEAFGPLYLVT